jgi:hypothetical protein
MTSNPPAAITGTNRATAGASEVRIDPTTGHLLGVR